MMQTPRDYQSRWRAFISEGGTQAREEPRPHRRPLEWTHAGIVGVLAARSAARPRGQELIEKLTLGAARLSVQLLDGSSETTTRPRFDVAHRLLVDARRDGRTHPTAARGMDR